MKNTAVGLSRSERRGHGERHRGVPQARGEEAGLLANSTNSTNSSSNNSTNSDSNDSNTSNTSNNSSL